MTQATNDPATRLTVGQQIDAAAAAADAGAIDWSKLKPIFAALLTTFGPLLLQLLLGLLTPKPVPPQA